MRDRAVQYSCESVTSMCQACLYARVSLTIIFKQSTRVYYLKHFFSFFYRLNYKQHPRCLNKLAFVCTMAGRCKATLTGKCVAGVLNLCINKFLARARARVCAQNCLLYSLYIICGYMLNVTLANNRGWREFL